MEKIIVIPHNLQPVMRELLILKSSLCEELVATTPKVGSGYVADKLVEIAENYYHLQKALLSLVDNTISFLSYMECSFEESDQAAASKISGNQ